MLARRCQCKVADELKSSVEVLGDEVLELETLAPEEYATNVYLDRLGVFFCLFSQGWALPVFSHFFNNDFFVLFIKLMTYFCTIPI